MAHETQPGRRGPRLTYGMAAVWSVVAVLLGYAVLDVADAAPGALTVQPAAAAPAHRDDRDAHAALGPAAHHGDLGRRRRCRRWPATPPPRRRPGIEQALAPVRALPALRDSALVVRDGQTGEVLLDQGGDELRIPASTTKLLSAAAVGQTFAPDETLRTVVREGDDARPDRPRRRRRLAARPGQGRPRRGRGPCRPARPRRPGRLGPQGPGHRQRHALRRRDVCRRADDGSDVGLDFRSSGITGAVAMLGLSTQRATAARPARPTPSPRPARPSPGSSRRAAST